MTSVNPVAGSPPIPQAAPAVPPQPAAAPPEANKPASLEETYVVGSAYEKTIADLMEMGFPRDQVVKCLKAAFNNPARATEYLLSVFLIN